MRIKLMLMKIIRVELSKVINLKVPCTCSLATLQGSPVLAGQC